MTDYPQATLYGINNSNRQPKDFWGKNMFNSSFPVALACYMRDHNDLKATYLKLDTNLRVIQDEISFDDVFNCGELPTNQLYFGFETKFDPYEKFLNTTLDHIDLVVKNNNTQEFLRPLEVKLTVLPDNSTYKKSENSWGCELVIRPDTTIYCALGIADACNNVMPAIRSIFERDCHSIESWGNSAEMIVKLPTLLRLINQFEMTYLSHQKPLILQPIWKTDGKNPNLAANAFDIFIWSDFAFTRLFLDHSSQIGPDPLTKISRQMRSALRFLRCIYEISKSGKVNLDEIYKQMTFKHQTDKEFAVNGQITNSYMRGARLSRPILSKEVVKEIILNGGENLLSPERRFDQTIFFTMVKD